MLVSILLPILNKRVYAEPLKPVEESKIYNAVLYLSLCASGRGFKGSPSLQNLKDGDFINQSGSDILGKAGQVWAVYGLTCKAPDVKKAISNSGMNITELLINNGVYRMNDANSGYVYSGLDNEQAAMNILNAATAKYPDGINFRGLLSKSAQYFVLKDAFLKLCSSGSPPAGSDGGVSVEIVSDSGSKSSKKFMYKEGPNKEVVVGPGITGTDVLSKLKCSDIVAKMNSFATEASTVTTALGGSGGDTSKGEDGDYKPSCEERTGLITGWIVCSAMELLSKGMDTVMDQVDNMLNVDVIEKNNASGGDLKKSWSSFRAIASFMLLAIGLVMILSQALGGGN